MGDIGGACAAERFIMLCMGCEWGEMRRWVEGMGGDRERGGLRSGGYGRGR